jgi:hypothetical protein
LTNKNDQQGHSSPQQSTPSPGGPHFPAPIAFTFGFAFFVAFAFAAGNFLAGGLTTRGAGAAEAAGNAGDRALIACDLAKTCLAGFLVAAGPLHFLAPIGFTHTFVFTFSVAIAFAAGNFLAGGLTTRAAGAAEAAGNAVYRPPIACDLTKTSLAGFVVPAVPLHFPAFPVVSHSPSPSPLRLPLMATKLRRHPQATVDIVR